MLTGAATRATVDEHVRRILRTVFAYGFFDRAAFADDDAQIDKVAHARVAERIEESAVTLLENDDAALPLDAARLRSLAIVGADADTFKTGGGSGAVTPFAVSTPRAAITQRAGPGVRVTYDDGSDPDAAAAAAKAADVAIVFAGDYQTEGTDKRCLTLECPPYRGDQDALIERVAAANPNTIVVLETGGPVLTPWRDRVRGLLEAWYPGQEGGTAIARVLFGDADPGGRLPATFPASEADEPTAGDPEKYPGVAETVTYKEGVLVGYRWFDAHGLRPAYPFGFGRSYTTFAYDALRIATAGGVTVTADVTNTGTRSGVAVPQLYVGLPSPGRGIVQPPRQLRGYTKLDLQPGERRTVRFTLDARALSYWDTAAGAWRVAPGCHEVAVGSSSRDLPLRGSSCRG
jgi:beta-glucosidase